MLGGWARIAVCAFVLPVNLPGQAPADRVVAEWTLRLGGSVTLEGHHRPITDIDELPDSDFRIRALNLTGVTLHAYGLLDELSRLPALPNLKELSLNGRLWYNQRPAVVLDTIAWFSPAAGLEKLIFSKPVQTYIPFDDAALKVFSKSIRLREVRLHQTTMPGAALAPFARLTHLDLSFNNSFDDTGMRALAGMPELTCLYLPGTAITDAGLKEISGLKQLEELDLGGDTISDAGLASLSGLLKLRRLNLESASITDAGMNALRGLKNLEALSLYRTKVSNAGLAKLARLPKLRDLDLRYSRVTGAGVADLLAAIPECQVQFEDSSNRGQSRHASVESVRGKGEEAIAGWLRSIGGKVTMQDARVSAVSLQSTPVTDRELAILRELTGLEELDLRDTGISDAAAGAIARLQTLHKLDLGYTQISDSGVEKLVSLTNLRELSLVGAPVEGRALDALLNLRNLERLDLNNCPIQDRWFAALSAKSARVKWLDLKYAELTDTGLAGLAAFGMLTHLDLAGVDVGDAGLAVIGRITGLEELNLSFGRFGDEGLEGLSGLKKLVRLNLAQTAAGDAGMAALAGLTKLQSLDLSYTAVTDAGLGKLVALSHLNELRLDSLNITDKSLRVLARFPLRQLDLAHTRVTEQGVNQLMADAPGCRISWDGAKAQRGRRS